MAATKKELIRHLETISIYLELKGENPFKVSAFRKAANALETDDRSLEELDDFTAISGIGKGTAAVLEEFIHNGSSKALQDLKEAVPRGLIPLLQLPGLGGKKIARLYQDLGVENAADLEDACRKGKVQALSGFGKKSEEKILSSIAKASNRPERLPLAFMLPIAEQIEQLLAKMSDVLRFSRAGSLRRMRETIKDLDFIIATEHPAAVKQLLLHLPNMKEIIGAGDTKVSVILDFQYEISIDFRLVKPSEFVTALHHFTGSKEHNVRMRQLAKERGEKISEYGVENLETGELLTFSSEEDFYRHFNLPFIPPEIREDGREVDEYTESMNLISLQMIKGDLHMHSTWSDGANSIEEMAEACRSRGYHYMAITDHSQSLKVAHGLTPERLLKQRVEINRLNEKYDDFTILAGVEMDILPDGSLDYDDELLEGMDIVIASIHSGFSQPRDKIMARLSAALKNAHVDIIAHPTGRLIGRREGYDADIDLLIALAKETNTVLELNANPNRLDLASEHLKKAQDAGVRLVINTDAHKAEALIHMSIGVASAKKGWIQKESVINTLDFPDLAEFLQKHKDK